MTTELNTQIAENLERARLALAEAEKAHAEALGRVEALNVRIASCQARQSDITAKRLAGEATEADTAELAALSYDLEALAVMLAKAESDAAALAPDVARNRLSQAETEWNPHETGIRIAAIGARAVQLETLLTACLGELATEAQQVGYTNFHDVWRPSPALETVMNHTHLTTVASVRRAA